jgi:hypothetical protein
MDEREFDHPAAIWERDNLNPSHDVRLRLRLAAMAGHMRGDQVAARRAALIDLLADGKPHTREEIWETVTKQLDKPCWGKRPQETLARDLKALRRGRIRIAYSRLPGATGYYLQYPPIERSSQQKYEEINWTLIERIRGLSVPEKNQLAFAATGFAMKQKQLILSKQHPNWTADEINRELRRLVLGSTAAKPDKQG